MANAALNEKPLVAMELKRHYRPAGDHQIVGWNKPARMGKDAAGKEIELEKAEFINDQMAAPPTPGVEHPGKIWAGTVVKVPEDEAKLMRSKGIAERAFDN